MSEFSTIQRFKHKVGETFNPIVGSYRRRKLNNTDFTIISNNCWGGVCYEYFNLPKLSPTVGSYFFADDYIRFISNLRHYLKINLNIVSTQESKHKAELIKRGQNDVLVGVLDDIEVILLHYHDKQVALEKWNRRINRINWDNLIFKFSYMNACTDEHIHQFEEIIKHMPSLLDIYNHEVKSLVFVPRVFADYSNAFVIKPGEDGQISNDTFFWNKYCDVISLINGK